MATVSKKKIFDEISQIPDDKNAELYRLIHSFACKYAQPKINAALKKLLLAAPVWGIDEEKNIASLRKSTNQWQIEQF